MLPEHAYEPMSLCLVVEPNVPASTTNPLPPVVQEPTTRGVWESGCSLPGLREFTLRKANGGLLARILVPEDIVDDWFISWLWEMLNKHDPTLLRLL